jgi:NTP pyrophosphatase (non-canonical NTP hydrolase)
MRREKEIIQWAKDRGIFDQSSRGKQYEKTCEEVHELGLAINCNDGAEIIDALGDIVVTLILQAEMNGVKLDDCIEYAYGQIKNRTGKMIDGKFVKDIEGAARSVC